MNFNITYLIFKDNEKDAFNLAKSICYEQTVELSPSLIKEKYIHKKIIGKIVELKKINNKTFEAKIEYPFSTSTYDISQIINIIYGNISFIKGIKVFDIQMEKLPESFKGAKFGITGVRESIKIFDRPLISTSLKPLGKTSKELANIAYKLACGGINIIKDDHCITDQKYSSFKERTKECLKAINNANNETGNNSLYVININAERTMSKDWLYYAKDLGIKAIMIFPGITGFDLAKKISNDPDLNFIIFAHPSILGSYILPKHTGFSAKFLAKLYRLIGIDVSIFPNFTGRFDITKTDCSLFNKGCKEKFSNLNPIFPMFGGGIKIENFKKIIKSYDKDVIYLIGESLYAYSKDLKKTAITLVNIIKGNEAFS